MTCMGARVLYRKGPWAPKVVSGTEYLEGMHKLGQRLKVRKDRERATREGAEAARSGQRGWGE